MPRERGGQKIIAVREYELISAKPYAYTQEEVLFTVHSLRGGVALLD